ncbi:flagellar assembly protein FliH [Frateuria aurantia]
MSTPLPPTRAEILQHAATVEARRWQGPDFFPPDPAAVNDEPAAPAPPAGPTVAELEAIEAQAREAGYKAGLEEGRQAAAAELAVQRQQLEQLFAAAARPLAVLDQQVEIELAELTLHIARQVVYRTIETRPEHILDTVRTSVAALPLASRDIKLRLHPDDAELLLHSSLNTTDQGWHIIPDPQLQRGDVEVDTEMSHVDARVETRLARMADTVLSSPAGTTHE